HRGHATHSGRVVHRGSLVRCRSRRIHPATQMPANGAESAATADFLRALACMGLLSPGETPRFTPLTGGVSSDILRVDLAGGSVCIKRALPRLKVSAEWQAP